MDKDKEIIIQLRKELEIADHYLGLIWDIGFDYDGYHTVENLKNLIDELVELAHAGLTRMSDEDWEQFVNNSISGPDMHGRKPDWEIVLYDKQDKLVLKTDNYETLAGFLGRRRETIYTFIYRAKRGLVRRVFDISGNAYTYDIKEF